MSLNDSGESKTPIIYAVSSSMMALAVLSLVVRFWARVKKGTYLWWDDWFALCALPFALAINTLFIISGRYGIGKHLSTIANPAYDSSMVMRLDVAIQFIMCIGATLIKLSALAFYARIFRRTKQMRIALWAVGAAAISYNVVEVISYCLRCGTIRGKNMVEGRDEICLSASSAEIPNCTIDVVADLAILLLPLPALASLNLHWRRKIELCVVFVLGCGFTIITLLREIFAIQVMQNMTEFEKDPFWLVIPFNIAAVCEQPVGLLTVSLPAAYTIIKDIGHRMLDAIHAAGESLPALTAYSNAPRLRSFLPLPSVGSTFAVRSNPLQIAGEVFYYGSQPSILTSGGLEEKNALKLPDKVHTVSQEIV